MKRLSIKLKVTLWFTLIMVIYLAVVMALLILLGERVVLAETRNLLQERVAESAEELEYEDGEWDVEDLDLYEDGVYLAVYSAEGDWLFGKKLLEMQEEPPFRDGVLQKTEGAGEKWFVYDLRQQGESENSAWVRGIVSAAARNTIFDTMLRLALFAAPLVVLGAAVIGYLLVAQAFRPIQRITLLAEQIADGEDLSRRIDLGEGKDEVYRLASTFDSMLARLQSSFDRERQFTADASHELRTPVTVMISQCELALEHAETLEEAKRALNTVLNQARRMSGMIGQMLNLARMNAGSEALQKETIDLSELTEMVADQMEERAAEKRITIHRRIQPDLSVEGDETMLMRMLLNLMDNGIKYGREDGNLWVEIRSEGEEIRGSVADDGIGISGEILPYIWDRFYQVDPSRDRAESGIGLGLPLVRSIVDAHGGEVRAESREGEGSTFFFSLKKKT